MEALQVNINQDYLNNLVNQFFKESLNGVTWNINEFLTERFFLFSNKKEQLTIHRISCSKFYRFVYKLIYLKLVYNETYKK